MSEVHYEHYKIADYKNEYYNAITITLGELIDSNIFSFSDNTFTYKLLNDNIQKRFETKFINRFYDREIGKLPYSRWLRALNRRLCELAPKYNLMYQLVEDNSIAQNSRTHSRQRNVYSDYPQTRLNNESQDYATNATDNEAEVIQDGNILDIIDRMKQYDDIDVQLLDELDSMFTSFITVNLNSI